MVDDPNAANAETNPPQQNGISGAPLIPSGAPVVPPPVAQPAPAISTPPSAPAPAASAAPAPSPSPVINLQDDINSILKGVKLPEREHPQNIPAQEPQKIDTALGHSRTGEALGANVEKAPSHEPPSPPREGLASVHTLKQDMQDLVRDEKISRVKAAALEQGKRRPEPIDTEIKEPSHTPMILFLILGLLSLGSLTLFVAYLYFSGAQSSQTSVRSDSLVFVEATKTIPIDNTSATALKATIAGMRSSSGPTLGSITRVVPTIAGSSSNSSGERAATFSEFMNAIGAHAPDSLVRALADRFFLGFHTIDKNAPVIVVPVADYDHAFAGMLQWESTMNVDLQPIFSPVPAFVTAPDGSVSQRTFSDSVIRNYDVRTLKNDSGETLLYYSFPTRSVLIIAESPYSFPEVITRLQAARQL